MRYQEEGISKKSKLALLVMLLALLSTLLVQRYQEYAEAERTIRSAELSATDQVISADNPDGGTITLPAIVRSGQVIKITAITGEWKVINVKDCPFGVYEEGCNGVWIE